VGFNPAFRAFLLLFLMMAVLFIFFSTAVGSEHMLQQFKHHTQHKRARGMVKARALLQQA
jgi:hypothetical protein